MTTSTPSVRSQCPYCGVGCGLELLPPAQPGQAVKKDEEGNPIWTARGDRAHPSSQGQVCIKGATVGETLARGRLHQPLYRASLDQEFQPVTWDQALQTITNQIQTTLANKGANAIAMYGSGQFHTEDYYLAQKLLKGALPLVLRGEALDDHKLREVAKADASREEDLRHPSDGDLLEDHVTPILCVH